MMMEANDELQEFCVCWAGCAANDDDVDHVVPAECSRITMEAFCHGNDEDKTNIDVNFMLHLMCHELSPMMKRP